MGTGVEPVPTWSWAGGVAEGEEELVGEFEFVLGNKEVNVGHGAEAGMGINQRGEVRAFQDGDFDAGGLEGGEDLSEVMIQEGVAGGGLEEDLLEGGEDAGGNFNHV